MNISGGVWVNSPIILVVINLFGSKTELND